MNSLSISFRRDSSIIKVENALYSWLVFLNKISVVSLKFSLLSIYVPTIFPLWNILMVSLKILLRKIRWNLSGFGFILFFGIKKKGFL